MSSISEEVILASGARTATQTGAGIPNPDAGGHTCAVEVVLDLTTFTTAAALTLSIEEFDIAAGAFRQVVASAVIAAAGTTRLRYGPTYPETANLSRTGHVGKQFRVVVTHGNANSCTYSVSIKKVRGVG